MPQDPELRKIAERRVGSTLCGKWHVDKLLDIGGMAAVYAATHRNGNRVAVKMLHPTYSRTPLARERFLREGYLANKVKHPASVSVLDDDTTEDGSVFLVMELLSGQSMEALLQRSGGVLSVQHVLAIADQTLDVLDAAHASGVIHRDIKPGNLFLTRQGQIKVLDFGLAKLKEADPKTQLTGVGVVMGTSSYMPPEQARSDWKSIDGRTDLFALGSVMFRALSSRVVHVAETPTDRLLAAMTKPAISLGVVDPRIPKPVVEVVDCSLKFVMDERYRDAKTMQLAVRQAFAVLAAQPNGAELLNSRYDPIVPESVPTIRDGARARRHANTVTIADNNPPHAQTKTRPRGRIRRQDLDRLEEVSCLLVEEVLTEADELSSGID
ncbi:MAG: serine/threonine protein kinase [Polyangiaceae bacterium]|nr:serine/threonine protein kinase [Polyangiaceae bacterium]